MAKLLDETALGARPTPEPASGIARYRADVPELEAPGQALMSAGRQLDSDSEKLFAAYKQEQAKVDTLRAEDAYTQLRNQQLQMTFGPGGYATLRGQDAVLGPDVEARKAVFEEAAKKIAETLGNDDQRRLFQMRAQIAGTEYQEGFLRHQLKERNVWATDVTNNGVQSELNQISALYARPGFDPIGTANATSASLVRMKALIESHAADLGMSASGVDKAMTAATDKAITNKLLSWASWDPVGAYESFKASQTELSDPAHRLQLDHQLKTMALPVSAKNDAMIAVKNGVNVPKITSALAIAGEPLINAVVAVESGGNPQAVSDKGALGRMQVMPATADNPGFGIQPAKDRSAPELERVGREYLSAMIAKYDGNQTLALAAYNAGPDQVDQWIAKFGDPNKGEITDAEFAKKIPFKETREYLPKVAAKLAGGITPTTATDTKASLINWVSNAERLAESRHPGDAVYRDMVVQQVKGYMSTIVASQEGIAKQAGAQLMVAALGQPGAPKPTTTDELLASPAAKQAWGLTSPESQRGVLALLEHNAKAARGEFTQSDPKVVRELFDRLWLPDGDPEKIRNTLQLMPYFARGLNKADYDWLGTQIDKVQTPEGNVWLREVKGINDRAHAMLTKSIAGSIQPDIAEEAAYRFRFDLEKQIAAKEKEKPGSARELFVPGTPGYVLEPTRVASFMTGTPQVLSAEAAKVVAGRAAGPALSPPIAQPAAIDTREKLDAWFATLPPTTNTFTGVDGKVRLIPGRAPQPGQPEAAPAAPAAGPAAPAPAAAPAAAAPAVAPPKPARDKDAIPAFRAQAGMSPEEQEQHLGGLWAAAKAVANASFNLEPAGRAIAGGVAGLVNTVIGHSQEFRETESRAMFQHLLEKDQFTPLDVPVVKAAVKYGNLDPGDLKKAKAMLKAAGAK